MIVLTILVAGICRFPGIEGLMLLERLYEIPEYQVQYFCNRTHLHLFSSLLGSQYN